ncbi:hypothetical protein QFC21_007145 [Naganishia friedmannii]|uniref:Uncharacterized protein n=1 Tax=Naganishia friedmannii TaxID=89922 RepID=A0ACC2UY56_9TREE|nr:hypothetical protein QFC21_007145 [Naganishia friedmannii]
MRVPLEDSTIQQGIDDKETVQQHVVRSDTARCKVQAEFEQSGSPLKMQQALSRLRLTKAREALADANDLALRRSGARGKEARTRQLVAEEVSRRTEKVPKRERSSSPRTTECSLRLISGRSEAEWEAEEAMTKKKEHIEASIQKGKETAKMTGDENRLRLVKSQQKKNACIAVCATRRSLGYRAKRHRWSVQLNRDLAGSHLSSRTEIVQDDVERRVKMSLPQPTKLRTSGDLIHFQDVAFRYPKTKTNVVVGVSFTVGQTGRCPFIGANGEGKSTIAKLVLGELQPTSGTITRHPTMKIGYFSQMSVEELSALSEEGDAPVTALTYIMAYFAKRGEAVEEQDAGGVPLREASDHEGSDKSALDSNPEDKENVRKGNTYRVGGGKARSTPGGMTQYIGIVERTMAKRDAAIKVG